VADSDENTATELAAPASRGGPWKLIALVAVLTVVAIILVPGRETTPPQALDKTADGTPTPAAPSLLPTPPTETSVTVAEPLPPLEPLPAGAPEDQGPGAAARRLIAELRGQRPPDLERAFTAAGEHQQAGRLEDAYLLYFYAAREGHGQAAMMLGQQADPASFRADGLFDNADPLQAHKWYTKARDAGIAEAYEALATLRSNIETAAQNGDLEAQRVTLQWK